MRLIEAEELFDKVGKIKPRNKEHYKSIGEFMHLISNLPTIDAVEVVRCKDCKYFENHCDCVKHSADILGYIIEVTDDDYCSYGERREE